MGSASFNSAEVDLTAIASNVATLVRRADPERYFADFRAQGYGHGQSAILTAKRAGAFESADVQSASIALYGITGDPELRAAMRVSGRVIALKTIDAGEGVSYGYTYRATRRTNLALVSLGYADGLPRSAGNVASLQLGGRLHRIAGRVAMNALVLDLGDDLAELGSPAVVFGDQRFGEPSILSWATAVGMTPAEAAIGFGSHLPLRYAGGVSDE